MSSIYSNSSLDAHARCRAQGEDASNKERHEKEGPSRQGQFQHYVSHLYVRHCFARQVPSDLEYGANIIEKNRGALPP